MMREIKPLTDPIMKFVIFEDSNSHVVRKLSFVFRKWKIIIAYDMRVCKKQLLGLTDICIKNGMS